MKQDRIIEIICSLLILLFVYTAFSKLLDFRSFTLVLQKSPFIGDKAAVVAYALPIVEVIVSALLFIPRSRLWGLYSSAVLMAMFTLYIAYMISFSPNLPCSCGGVLRQMTWNQHLFFNIIFFLLSLTGVLLKRKQMQKEKEMAEETPPVVYT
jgi:putative oxidoreductase